MTYASLIETSVFISLFRKIQNTFVVAGAWLYDVLTGSQVYKMAGIIRLSFKTGFDYSFLGRTTERLDIASPEILKGSNFIKWFLGLYGIWRGKVVYYFKISMSGRLVVFVNKAAYFLSPQTLGIILVSAVITNTTFFILLNGGMGMLSCGVRVLFLFIGIGMSSSYTGWQDIITTSFVLRQIRGEKILSRR